MKFIVILFSLSGLCFATERPNLDIKIQSSFICENGKSLSGPEFKKFCKKRNDVLRVLYANLIPGNKILYKELMQESGKLGSVYDWCTKEVNDQRVGPSCVLRVSKNSSLSSENLSVSFLDRKNFIRVNIGSLQRGSRYTSSLVEWGSGSNVSSQLFEINNP
ncbi:MAG: hypothetical protein CME70_08695 [Halobacteriovorax sp.]|nr:hypothetical protein [Halobacteriovorax sp.]|tara:strand:+ start:102193 stop:102678 length:486 start_codon:yes stop_codon:yes gene_type:complete